LRRTADAGRGTLWTIDDPNRGANKAHAGIEPMSLLKWAFVALLILPLAEIGVLILAAAAIGWPLTIVLFVATSVLGVILLQKSGGSEFERLRQAIGAEGLLGLHLESPGLGPVLGAILLVIPGFVTDIVGAALFVPQCRRWASAALAKAARRRRYRARARDKSVPPVIDLEPGEWHQEPDRSPGGERESKRAGRPKRKV
jgi:UPF0716 protein FxsA